MLVRQPWKSNTPVAPLYRVDHATGRLTIEVRDVTLLELVPVTVRRAAIETTYDTTMAIVIDCRRSPSAPETPAIRRLAESMADSWDSRGPIALMAPGIDVLAVRRALRAIASHQVEDVFRVFVDELSMDSWLAHSLIEA